MEKWKQAVWADTVAWSMLSYGGTYTYDDVHIGGYIHGTATQDVTYRGTTINEDSLFYIPVLATEALDTIVSYFVANGYRNFGLFDISTDARTPASDKLPLHNHLGSLITIGEDSTISATSGGGQSGAINTALALPMVVTVLDNYGFAVPNVPVTFSIYSTPEGATGQSLSATSTTTDEDGVASTTLTLGSEGGSYVVRATANLTESPISFSANGVVPPPPGLRVPFRRR